MSPTGVELSSAFAEIRKNILPKDYPRIDFSRFRIILIEGTKNTLNIMSENARQASRIYIERMEVGLLMETIVSDYDGNVLTLKDGKKIVTKTVIWAAGVTGNKINGLPESYYAVSNRLKVNRLSKIEGSENIFALRDIALMEMPKFPEEHPQLANFAVNQAQNLAQNLKKIEQGENTKPFEYEH